MRNADRMSGTDSGVETGSELSNESNCMSVESSRSDQEQDNGHGLDGQAEETPADPIDPPAGLSFLNIQPLLNECGYSTEYKQYEHHSKIRPGALQRKHEARWKHVHGVYTDVRDVVGERKLRVAANTGNLEAVRKLLDEGVDPCAADGRKRTALHFAACKGYLDIAQLLIERGADPNQKDIIGNTPMHLAACTTRIEIITLLLKSGADLTALDNLGRTPLRLAMSKLKMLQGEPFYSSSQLKDEVLQVVNMMLAYLQRSGKQAELNALSTFLNRLQHHQTKEEVDTDVKDLLSSLSHLSLDHS